MTKKLDPRDTTRGGNSKIYRMRWLFFLLGMSAMILFWQIVNQEKPRDFQFEGAEEAPDIKNMIDQNNIDNHVEKFIPSLVDFDEPNDKYKLTDKFKFNRTFAIISTDREVYRPGDSVRIRVSLLDLFTFEPIKILSGMSIPSKIVTPSLAKREAIIRCERVQDVALCFGQINLKNGDAGGEYKIEIDGHSNWVGGRSSQIITMPGAKTFQVRSGGSKTNNKLSMSLKFSNNAIGKGESIEVRLENVTKLSTGAFAAGGMVSWQMLVNGKHVWNGNSITDASGSALATIDFPEAEYSESMYGTIVAMVAIDGAIESVSKTIPFVPAELHIEFYPEGGVLIPGHSSRLYLQVRNPETMEPADLHGHIVEHSEGQEFCSGTNIAEIQTVHEGRGVSEVFDIRPNYHYMLCLDRPIMKRRAYDIPTGTEYPYPGTLTILETAVSAGSKIHAEVQVSNGQKYQVGLFKHEKQIALSPIVDHSMKMDLEVPLHYLGIIRATLFHVTAEGDLIPVSERLCFSRPNSKIVVEASIDDHPLQDYRTTPRAPILLKLRSYLMNKDGSKVPTSAIVSTRITDLSRESLVESRKRQPSLRSHVLFANELRDTFDSETYEAQSKNMDMLLGTQGWRRFAYRNITAYLTDKSLETEEQNWRFRVAGIDNTIPIGFKERAGVMLANRFMFKNARAFPEAADGMVAMNDDMPDDLGGMPVLLAAAVPMAFDEAVVADEHVVREDEFQPMMAMGAQEMGAPLRMPPQDGYRVSRVFAHMPKSSGNARSDFAETLYWDAGVFTEPNEAGNEYETILNFTTGDSLTTFRVYCDILSNSGVLGYEVFDFTSSKAVNIDTKLPVASIVGDRIWAPVSIEVNQPGTNNLELELPSQAISLYRLKMNEGFLLNAEHETFSFKLDTERGVMGVSMKDTGKKSIRMYVPIEAVTEPAGEISDAESSFAVAVSVSGNLRSQVEADRVIRGGKVASAGFPIRLGSAGTLGVGQTVKWSFDVPSDIVPYTLKVQFKAYPSPVGQLLDVVKSLLRKPCGCFEQTSSTVYPMILALRYLVTLHDPEAATFIESAQKLLREGYMKLVSYETSTGGFEWFGQSPGHEALTAYGLLQYALMMDPELGLEGLVDTSMVERTQQWLLGRRDGVGEFLVNPKSLDSFGRAPKSTTNVYILWSLARTKLIKPETIKPELDWLLAQVKKPDSGDPYSIALAACILFDFEIELELAEQLLVELKNMQHEDGYVSNTEFATITNSGGRSRLVEATALSVMAWLRAPKRDGYLTLAAKAVEFIGSNAREGVYGSTQATALGLEAIVEYIKLMNRSRPTGAIKVDVTGSESHTFKLTPDSMNVLQHVLSPVVDSGSEVMVTTSLETEESRASDDSYSLPFMIDVSFSVRKPPSNDECALELDVTLSQTKVVEGETVTIEIVVKNRSAKPVGMGVAIIGIPSGTEPRMNKLLEMQQANKIAFFETNPSSVTLYWRGFDLNQDVMISLDLETVVPGIYTLPASQAYLYYEDEYKVWVGGDKSLTITPLYIENAFGFASK